MNAQIHSALLCCIGAVLLLCFHRHLLGGVILASGIFLLIAAQLYPSVSRSIGRLNKKVSLLVSSVATWVILAPFYVLVFSLGRAVLALRGKDPMRLKFPSNEPSYWLPISAGQGSDDARHPY